MQRLAHLLRRAGFGATPEELREALARGYEDTLEDLLNPQRVEESPALAEDLLYRYFPDTAAELRAAMPFLAYRMVNTRRPLQEKMALFWHNLFATARSKVRVWTMATQYEMFRRHALDRFDQILLALSRDPAMILWLDNKDSTSRKRQRELRAGAAGAVLDGDRELHRGRRQGLGAGLHRVDGEERLPRPALRLLRGRLRLSG